MAFRYLRAHKIIYFSIFGVAVGILTLVMVTSIMGGFSRDMRSRIRGMLTDLVVSSYDKNLWIVDYEALSDAIGKIPHVKGCAPRLEYAAWLGRRGVPRDVVIMGVLPERERRVGQLEEYFRKGGKRRFDFEDEREGRRSELPGVVLGSELFGGDVTLDGRLGLITARHQTTPLLCAKDFVEVGRFRSGMTDYDSNFVFMHLPDAQDFLKLSDPPRVNQLAVAVDDYERHADDVAARILDLIHERSPCASPEAHRGFRCGLYRIQTWEQVRGTLLAAVEVERGLMIIILFLIVVVAAFNIASIYTLVVRAKTRDIGILRALGATEGGITSVFLMSGGLCGVIGSICGLVLGLLMAHNANEIEAFVRVVSREMNRARLDSGASWWAAGALLAAGVAVVWNWLVLYKERRAHPWVRMGAGLVALGAAAWLSTTWVPAYRPYPTSFDPDLGGGFRVWLTGAVAAVWILLVGSWRFLDRWRRRPGWIFYGFFATILFTALLLAIVAALSIAVSVSVMQPGFGWRGLELFNRNIYYLDRIPVYVDYSGLALIVVMTLVVSIIFSIYPAMRASAADPIEAIRDE
jgi:lipoprotein-releasing system permease protein